MVYDAEYDDDDDVDDADAGENTDCGSPVHFGVGDSVNAVEAHIYAAGAVSSDSMITGPLMLVSFEFKTEDDQVRQIQICVTQEEAKFLIEAWEDAMRQFREQAESN